jgi:hypothetical protein
MAALEWASASCTDLTSVELLVSSAKLG